MTETQTKQHFRPYIGDTFSFPVQGHEALSFELVEVNSLNQQKESLREPFNLIFKGPSKPQVPQGTYRLDHDTLGSLVLFMVPVGATDGGLLYESLFN
jgi:hypothetical protein